MTLAQLISVLESKEAHQKAQVEFVVLRKDTGGVIAMEVTTGNAKDIVAVLSRIAGVKVAA